ncbi:hypothetical protein AAVH_09651 [Aphelenchoides avenae]|nr:hypothetical protein AAVH_09651 [Aphelenchus avenae]
MPAWERTIVDKANIIAAYPCHDRMELYISDKARPLLLWTILDSSPPCLAAFIVVNVTYATVVFCAYKVHRFLRRSTFGTNPARQSLQRQVGWALLAQAITPMFVFVLPLGAGIVVVISGAVGLRSVIVSSTSFCSWIPVVNPIFTIYFIKPYRHALLGSLIAKLRRSRVAQTTSVTVGSFQLDSIAA